ncbi:MAG: hypothetical protein RR408_06040 [Carnobacterium sp.]
MVEKEDRISGLVKFEKIFCPFDSILEQRGVVSRANTLLQSENSHLLKDGTEFFMKVVQTIALFNQLSANPLMHF